MKHYGDVTKIKGDDVPIVDALFGGSPCQDLSVAGKRAGLDGERSGLFMEQIRITKEMRDADRRSGRPDELCRPRFFIWENVPGALSSGQPKGADFGIVLTEVVRIAEPKAADVPMPKDGWPNAGLLYDEMGNWSVAWRVHDAQFWGTTAWPTPQRRRRIALVADFGGLCAGEILFEREGLSRHSPKEREAWERASGDTEDGAGDADCPPRTLKVRGGCDVDRNGRSGGKGALIQTDLSGTLGVTQDQTLFHKRTDVSERLTRATIKGPENVAE